MPRKHYSWTRYPTGVGAVQTQMIPPPKNFQSKYKDKKGIQIAVQYHAHGTVNFGDKDQELVLRNRNTVKKY